MEKGQIKRNRRYRKLCLIVFAITTLFLSVGIASTTPMVPQAEDSSSSERKLVTRVEPDYPETLKRLFIGGVVRVETTVNANGTVEDTQLVGGNPILGQAAMKAIKQWKYAPGAAKEKIVVKLTFDPHR